MTEIDLLAIAAIASGFALVNMLGYAVWSMLRGNLAGPGPKDDV